MSQKIPVKQITTAVITIVIILFLAFIKTMFFTVQSNEQAVVLTLGKYTSTVGEGLHFKLPYPVQSTFIVNVSGIRKAEIGFVSSRSGSTFSREKESTMLTGDENIINVEMEVQYQIRNPKDFLFNVQDPPNTIKSAAESALRTTVGHNRIDTILTTGKDQIMMSVQKELQSILDFYKAGIDVLSIQLPSVNAPKAVIDAFEEVQRAKEDKMTLINEAVGYRNTVIPLARGEAEKNILEAEGFAAKVETEAEGNTERFLAMLTEYKLAKVVTKKRMHLEAMESVLPGIKKYLISGKQNGALLNMLNLNK